MLCSCHNLPFNVPPRIPDPAALASTLTTTLTAHFDNARTHTDRPEAWPVREKYANVVPAEGSVVDLLVRAKNKLTGQPLKAHQIVAQVG